MPITLSCAVYRKSSGREGSGSCQVAAGVFALAIGTTAYDEPVLPAIPGSRLHAAPRRKTAAAAEGERMRTGAEQDQHMLV